MDATQQLTRLCACESLNGRRREAEKSLLCVSLGLTAKSPPATPISTSSGAGSNSSSSHLAVSVATTPPSGLLINFAGLKQPPLYLTFQQSKRWRIISLKRKLLTSKLFGNKLGNHITFQTKRSVKLVYINLLSYSTVSADQLKPYLRVYIERYGLKEFKSGSESVEISNLDKVVESISFCDDSSINGLLDAKVKIKIRLFYN